MRRRTLLGGIGAAFAGVIAGTRAGSGGRSGDVHLGDDEFANGRRRALEDRYELTFEWRDHASRRWTVDHEVTKEAFEAAIGRERGYLRSFERARSSDHARRLTGRILAEAAPAGQSTDTVWSERDPPGTLPEGEKLELVAGFAQSFRHALDQETKGVYDYHRTVEETLVEGIGDCKDTTYLLVGLLSQPPFEYRTAMVVMPGHVLVGIRREDLPEDHDYEHPPSDATLPGDAYVPIETTTSRPIGYVRDDPVLAIYDGTVHYLDGSESLRTIGGALAAL